MMQFEEEIVDDWLDNDFIEFKTLTSFIKTDVALRKPDFCIGIFGYFIIIVL